MFLISTATLFLPLTFYSILGIGTSSTVYLIDTVKAEKHFESPEDLLNEKTIYSLLGNHPRILSIKHMGVNSIAMEWMKNGDLARCIRSQPDIVQLHKN